MRTALTAVLLGVTLLTSALAVPQSAPTRYRGTIASVSGDVLAVKATDGRTVDVRVTDKTNIVFAQPIPFSEIKPGDFLAVTSVKRVDGTLTAYDVRRMMKPTNPGHRPFDGSDKQTMTNATLSATTVNATKGRELTLTYEGGSQKVVIAETAALTTLGPGQRSQLVPGSYVSLLADAEADGKHTARSIEVRKDAPKAPN
jgi:hypothetical protein